MKRKQARRESPPPSRWIRSKTGTYAYVVHCSARSPRGEKLYRLRYWIGEHQETSSKRWTLRDLTAAGVRWLKNKPAKARRSA